LRRRKRLLLTAMAGGVLPADLADAVSRLYLQIDHLINQGNRVPPRSILATGLSPTAPRSFHTRNALSSAEQEGMHYLLSQILSFSPFTPKIRMSAPRDAEPEAGHRKFSGKESISSKTSKQEDSRHALVGRSAHLRAAVLPRSAAGGRRYEGSPASINIPFEPPHSLLPQEGRLQR
jgi:hypothetical protein